MENKLGNKIEILGLSELANISLRNNGIDTVQDLMLLINKKLLEDSENKPNTTAASKPSPTQYITLKEAISETLITMYGEFSFKDIREKIRKRYRGRITAKMESIKPYLSSFVKQGYLERTESGNYIKITDMRIPPLINPKKTDLDSFLQSNIGKEIEFRYKSSRPKSENRWRKEKVLRYDDHYLYVERQFPSGHHVCYQKQRIVKYRRFVEFERND